MPDLATRLGSTTTGQLLVRSGIEIERLLNALVHERAPLTGKLSDDLMFLSRVLQFDPAPQQVMLAYSDHKPANSAMLAAKSVTFMCNHGGAQFAFAGTKPVHALHAGQPAIRMGAPKIMLAMQHHRNQSRAQHLPDEADVRCELWMGVMSVEARLVDMSLDGRAYLLADAAVPVCAGTRLPKARIVCDGRAPLVVDIEVDQVNLGVQHNGKRATRLGCRIVTEPEKLEQIIRLFIIDLQ
jgi:c-di-GMP-binding flagellar brake protein YcgR